MSSIQEEMMKRYFKIAQIQKQIMKIYFETAQIPEKYWTVLENPEKLKELGMKELIHAEGKTVGHHIQAAILRREAKSSGDVPRGSHQIDVRQGHTLWRRSGARRVQDQRDIGTRRPIIACCVFHIVPEACA